MKIFITGSESFIGKVLWEMLTDAGHEVSGVDVASPSHPAAAQMDLRDERLGDCIPEGATVIHLAAVSTDSLCKADPLTALDININGTLQVARACLRRNAAQLLFASSEWVYGDVANDEIQTEESAIDATRIGSLYAFSKLAGERILRFSGIANVSVLRFGIVYGPKRANWSAVESLIDKIHRGEALSVGSLKTSRRFIHVLDLCRGIVAAIGQKGFSIFNLSGDTNITLGDIAAAADKVLGKKTPLTETNPAKISVRNPANMKARGTLHWAPTVPFEDGVKEFVEYLKQTAQA